MSDALLVLHVNLKVSDHDHAAVRANAFLSAAKLAGFHVPLHDVHAVLLVEGYAGNFIEADDIVLADQAALAARVIDEHAGDGRLAARYQMRIWRNLLEKMAFAGASG